MNLSASDLVHEVAARHAASKLEAAHHILVSFSSGGLAFTAKAQFRALTNAQARLSPARQQVSRAGKSPSPWTTSIADSDEMKAGSPSFDQATDDSGGGRRTLAPTRRVLYGPTS